MVVQKQFCEISLLCWIEMCELSDLVSCDLFRRRGILLIIYVSFRDLVIQSKDISWWLLRTNLSKSNKTKQTHYMLMELKNVRNHEMNNISNIP